MAESQFLHALFEGLNSAGVDYCVLRNYEQLPASTGGSDIDIGVAPAGLAEVARLVAAHAREFGGEVVVDYVGSGQFIRILGCFEGEWWGVAVDLFPEIAYRGVKYIDCGQIIARGRHHGVVRVADDDDAAIIALVKELISNGKTRKGYLPAARAAFARRGEPSLELLEAKFSQSTRDRFIGLLEGEAEAGIAGVVTALRADALRGGRLSQRLGNCWARARRLLRPPGIAIAVLGTDGAGKTTVIGAIRPVLEQSMHSPCDYEHLRPNWIPRLGKLVGKADSGDVVENPHAQKPSGMVGSLVRLLYYAIDYSVGYWIKIHPRLARGAKICVFDRYYYDLIMDPRRMRIALPRGVIKLALALAPQPRLVLCLGTAPEKIYARKPETSLAEVQRQVDDLKQLCARNRRAVWVDTGAGIERSCDSALEAVQKVMGSR